MSRAMKVVRSFAGLTSKLVYGNHRPCPQVLTTAVARPSLHYVRSTTWRPRTIAGLTSKLIYGNHRPRPQVLTTAVARPSLHYECLGPCAQPILRSFGDVQADLVLDAVQDA